MWQFHDLSKPFNTTDGMSCLLIVTSEEIFFNWFRATDHSLFVKYLWTYLDKRFFLQFYFWCKQSHELCTASWNIFWGVFFLNTKWGFWLFLLFLTSLNESQYHLSNLTHKWQLSNINKSDFLILLMWNSKIRKNNNKWKIEINKPINTGLKNQTSHYFIW